MGVGVFWFGSGMQEFGQLEFISDSFEKEIKFRFFRVRGKIKEKKKKVEKFEVEEKEYVYNI